MSGEFDQLLRLADPAADDDLLCQLSSGAGSTALAELVRRHGPGVFGVCRRVLGHEHDAEDAFQATFLVLVRKATSVRQGASVRAYLFGVARNVALRMRDKDRRRRRHELATGRPEAAGEDLDQREWAAALDEEIGRLPERYRAPLISCHLWGQTQEEAARDLGWSLSTLRRRLESGRELLRVRLVGRGVVIPAAAAIGGEVVPVPKVLAGAVLRTTAEFLNGDRGSTPALLHKG